MTAARRNTDSTLMAHLAQYFPITDPTLIFFVVMIIVLSAPIIMGKLRIPHIIGMVLAGVLVGEHGLNILERDDSFELFGNVGLYYIMFLAALETNTESMRRNQGQLIVSGLLNFAAPFFITFLMSKLLLGYSDMASWLLGCIMASNTLIAYPIVGRYGLQREKSVMLSVGATMIALFIALVVLATIVSSFNHEPQTGLWIVFVLKLVAFCAGILFLIPRCTRWFLRRHSDSVMQFIYIMSVMFLSAAISDAVGLEGIFGAFLSGLVLNRYIPRVSPLMNHIEFIGNAIFIPFFLIGVGMLINVSLLFKGGNILWVVCCITLFGTIGKAVASYLSAFIFRLPKPSGSMMFGLTSAHAAGAIAMITVGMRLEVGRGIPLVSDDMLNGVIIMILVTCIISTIVTERSAKAITLRDKEYSGRDDDSSLEKQILIPVKYPEYANRLINLGILMRDEKRNQGIVALNVVYDDDHMRANQEQGRRLLEQVSKYANSADVNIQTQVRIAANIANGIKHAFKEFHASEIILGMERGKNESLRFWGQFHKSLFNGINQQIIMARLVQPLNTIRRIHVAVPSRAQYEPGFYQWLERLACIAGNLECRMQFHARTDTLELIRDFMTNRHRSVRAEYAQMEHWNELPKLSAVVSQDHLFVIISARKGTVSYKNALDHLPEELYRHFNGKNTIVIFPNQYGEAIDEMTFAEPLRQNERSAYEMISEWIHRQLSRLKRQ